MLNSGQGRIRCATKNYYSRNAEHNDPKRPFHPPCGKKISHQPHESAIAKAPFFLTFTIIIHCPFSRRIIKWVQKYIKYLKLSEKQKIFFAINDTTAQMHLP